MSVSIDHVAGVLATHDAMQFHFRAEPHNGTPPERIRLRLESHVALTLPLFRAEARWLIKALRTAPVPGVSDSDRAAFNRVLDAMLR